MASTRPTSIRARQRTSKPHRQVHRLLQVPRQADGGRANGRLPGLRPSRLDRLSAAADTTYNIFGAQIVEARIGRMTSGTDFDRDPGRDPNTGTNSFILA